MPDRLRGTTHRRDSASNEREHPVFVVGLGRSGTSLIRSLINGHPEFAVAPEIHFLDRWMPQFRRLDLARSFDAFWEPFVAGKHFPRLQVDRAHARAAILAAGPPTWRQVFRTLLIQHAAVLGRPRWGEKTPVYLRHIARLLDWFPGASVVYLLRDPRGVAASHQAVDTEWADLDPAHVAETWLESVRILESWANEPRVRLFRYEDIVTVPSEMLEGLFLFLGTRFDPGLLERRRSGEILRANGSFGPGAPISATHVDRWQERLSERDVSVIEHIAGPVMDAYGYERVSTGLGARTLTKLQIARARRNVLRVARALKEPREAAYRLAVRVRPRAHPVGKQP